MIFRTSQHGVWVWVWVSASSPLPSIVRVTGDFIQGSTATGVLVIIFSQSDDSNIHYYSGEQLQIVENQITVNGLTGGQYGVSVFAMEIRLPFSRAAALPQFLQLKTLNAQQSMCARHSGSLGQLWLVV